MEAQQGQIVPFDQKFKHVSGLLDKMKPAIAAALPKHLAPDRMLRIVLTSIRRNPVLLECEPSSLAGAVLESAQLGLPPDGVLGSAYIVPYKDRKTGKTIATLIPGYKGLIDLALRSGKVSMVDAEAVHQNDEFRYSRGLNPELHHIPTEGDDVGPLRAAYAVAQMTDGTKRFVVMLRRQVEKIRNSSQSYRAGFGPWIDWTEEMWKKTAIRRLCKMLPLSPEIQLQILREEALEAGADPRAYDADVVGEVLAGPLDGNGDGPGKIPSKLEAATEELKTQAEAEKAVRAAEPGDLGFEDFEGAAASDSAGKKGKAGK